MKPIPVEYLSKMGTYSAINIHGITLSSVKYADCPTLMESLISEVCSSIKLSSVKVVGIDIKSKSRSDRDYLLVLTVNKSIFCKQCLIFDVDLGHIPESVKNFLKDPNICFVGPHGSLLDKYNYYHSLRDTVVGVGELAARALKKPGLTTSSLADIAREAGVRYDGPPTGTGSQIQVDERNPRVLSKEMVKTAINDACACLEIGHKLDLELMIRTC